MASAQIPVVLYQKPSTENGQFCVAGLRLAWTGHSGRGPNYTCMQDCNTCLGTTPVVLLRSLRPCSPPQAPPLLGVDRDLDIMMSRVAERAVETGVEMLSNKTRNALVHRGACTRHCAIPCPPHAAGLMLYLPNHTPQGVPCIPYPTLWAS